MSSTVMYGIYKYVIDDTPIYIGKGDIQARCKEHKLESKFDDFFKNGGQIYYIEMDANEADIAEKYLVNKYKPSLNKRLLHNEKYAEFVFDEREWKLLPEQRSKQKHRGIPTKVIAIRIDEKIALLFKAYCESLCDIGGTGTLFEDALMEYMHNHPLKI